EAPSGQATLALRIPAWADAADLKVNGEPAGVEVVPGSYARITREWQTGDAVSLDLPMRVRRLRSHPRVLDNRGHVALARGPVVYCVEEADHAGVDVYDLGLAPDAAIASHHKGDLLGGVTVLEAEGVELNSKASNLYQEQPFAAPGATGSTPLKAIPYFVWANRGAGKMRVWIPEA
ncbi:MAG TPA: glycoside hydrolase family 127 protein, partial [Chloroflexota bacterium]|nr:glycoside hydrolase family 127 protein [Chloroflexota bacterium]